MHYRHVARQWVPKRLQSFLVCNPVFQGNIFSQRKSIGNVLEVAPDTYPNPLFSFDKDQLLKLNIKELHHLLQLPMRSLTEANRFHQNIIEIFHENLIKDTRLAVLYLDLINDNEVRKTVFSCLRDFYQLDSIRLSILSFIDNPDADDCRELICKNLQLILLGKKESQTVAAGVALNYMRKLAFTGRINSIPIILPFKPLRNLFRHLPKDQWILLYSAMVQTNIKFESDHHYNLVKTHLLKGSMLERFVARTGMLDAKWHDTETAEFSGPQKQKMLNFFSLTELAAFTQHALRRKDIVLSNLYLELLVSKFEMLSDPNYLQLVLSVMLSHSMAFKGPQECVKFLRYIQDSELRIVSDTLLRILTSLRLEKFYDEALLLVNYLHSVTLTSEERTDLAAEIMKIIAGKFARHPKIAVGYYVSLFNDETDSALNDLKDLMLLDLLYGPGSVDSLFDAIEKADIHEDLKNSVSTHSNLREMYAITFQSLPQEQNTSAVLIANLYEKYLMKLQEADTQGDKHTVFGKNGIDESIVNLFLDYLLRENPQARNEMKLVHDKLKFETAKHIFNHFVTSQSDAIKGTYILDLLITSSLLKHQDLAFAISVFKKGRELNLPITFNQIHPIIIHHYLKGEVDRARQWFMLLMQSGAKAKSIAADELFDIAKEQNWPHTGSMYRNSVAIKSRKSREEMKNLRDDPAVGLGAQDEDNNNINLGENLEQILHEMILSNKAKTSLDEEDI